MAISVKFIKQGGQCFADIRNAEIGTDVEIYDYKKVLSTRNALINLTQYLNNECDIATPNIQNGETINSWSGANTPTIKINDVWYYATFTYMPYAIDGAITPRILSDIRKPRVGFGQWAQIYVGMPGAERPNTYIYEEGFYRDTYLSNTNIDEIGIMAGRVKSNKIGFIAPASEAFPMGYHEQEYDVRPISANAIRLAWLNKYGCVDLWTFEFMRESDLSVSSESIYANNGYEKLNIKSEKHILIETRELDRATLDALSYIARSPHVWLLDDDGTGANDEPPQMEEINVITDSVRIYSDSELSTLQLEICPKVRI